MQTAPGRPRRLTIQTLLLCLLAGALLACSFPYMVLALFQEPTITPTPSDTSTITNTASPSASPSASQTPLPGTLAPATVTLTPTNTPPTPQVGAIVYTPIAALGAPNLISPNSTSGKMRPYYEWSPVVNASLYTIWVWQLDQNGQKRELVVNEQHRALDICSPSLCQIRPDVQLTDSKQYTWVVQAYGSPGYSPFSAQLTFTATKMTVTPGPSIYCPLTYSGKFGGGTMNAVAVATSTSATITYAYVGDGSTFKILEVSHTSPKFTIIEKGKISLGATINGIEIIEGSSRRYAYVAAGSAGVRILDVTDIDFPAQIGVFSSANQAFSVRYFQSLFPNYLFVADGTNGLRIITLNDPQNPTQFAIKDTPGSVQDVYVASTSYAYIADYTSGLRILNISGLPGINEDSYENDRTKKSNSVSGFGNFALMADEDSGIINIDITNLSTLPTPISPKPSPLVSMKGFDIEKDSLSNFYIVGGDRYYILNSAFVTQKFSTILHDAHDIAILDNYAYIADGAYGLQVFDNSSTLTDTIGSFDPSILAYDVVISGNSAYVADYNGRLVRLGLSTPNAPSLEGSAYLPDPVSCSYPTNKGNPYAVGIDSANIYVAANDGDLRWHDINTFINDVVLLCPASSVCNGGYAKGITVPGDGWIYVACNDTGVAKGTSPLSGFIPPYSVSGLANGLKVSGNNIYVAAYQKGLQILTTSGVLAGYYPTSGTVPGNYHNVGRYSHFAFAVADTAGLQVINLATPGAPFLETSLDTPGNAINITIVDTTAFIADSGSGIEVIDIGNPTYPKTLCTYNTEGIARSVAISGKYVFVADDSNGLVVLQMPMTPTPKP